MTERSEDWNKGLVEDLQDDEFVREFVAAAIEEGVPLKAVLLKLSAANRAELAMALWESLSDEQREAASDLSDEQKAELDRRWAAVRVIEFGRRDQQAFVDALLNSEPPNKRLVTAAKKLSD